MARWNTTKTIAGCFVSTLLALLQAGCGGYSGGGGNGGGGGSNAPSAPAGLMASAANRCSSGEALNIAKPCKEQSLT